MPKFEIDSPDSHRHRYFLARNLGRHPGTAGRKVLHHLSPLITRQRAPSSYAKYRHLLDRDHETQINELFKEWDRQIQQNEQLENQLRATEDSYMDALTEIEDLNVRLFKMQRNITEVWRSVDAASAQNSVEHYLHDESHEDDTTEFELPESCSEAAELARKHLHNISFPEEACVDLSRLDAAIGSSAWAKTAWRAFVNLDAYAKTAIAGTGGFRQWCDSGESSWSSSIKKLAMVESESVRQNQKLRKARELPVDRLVDPSGQIFMEAHLKVSRGGGPLAPRIYFYDDTGGKTRKIHVGFFGPHDHMPNKNTN